jgi:hypothetical protein
MPVIFIREIKLDVSHTSGADDFSAGVIRLTSPGRAILPMPGPIRGFEQLIISYLIIRIILRCYPYLAVEHRFLILDDRQSP